MAAPVTVTVEPYHQFNPGTIKLNIHLEPHQDNFLLCYGYNSNDGDASRSCRELNGQYAQRSYQMDYRNIGPGTYDAYAEVYRVPNRLAARDHHSFIVIDNDQHN